MNFISLLHTAVAYNLSYVEFKNFTKTNTGTSKNFTFLNCKKRPAHLIKIEGRRRPRISDGLGTSSKLDSWVFEVSWKWTQCFPCSNSKNHQKIGKKPCSIFLKTISFKTRFCFFPIHHKDPGPHIRLPKQKRI